MLFSSFTFILLFLPVFFAFYLAFPQQARSYVIVLFSCIFYAWWRVDFLVLILAISAITYAIGYRLERTIDKPRKLLLWIGVGANLATLGYFKYEGMVAETLNVLMHDFGIGWSLAPSAPILPIGISFHVFQSISFLVDLYRRETTLSKRPIDFAAFSLLFPQLIAGPVVKYKDIAPQLIAPLISVDNILKGAVIFAIGLSKKVLIADSIVPIVDYSFGLSNPSFLEAWTGAIAYAMQLFFDFSGYTDMAIGIALAMGIIFPRNFDDPYLSRSIAEFWRRWHMSLSSWLREYLYIPLGGNRKGTGRTYFNLMTTMTLGGLWHGASWTFALWGAWHGLLLTVERALGRPVVPRVQPAKLPLVLSIAATFFLVTLGWILFRASTLQGAISMFAGTVGVNGFAVSDFAWIAIPNSAWVTFALALLLCFAVAPWRRAHASVERAVQRSLAVFALPIFVLSIFRLVSESTRPFLYFQF